MTRTTHHSIESLNLDLSSLGYISAVPKDVRNLIQKYLDLEKITYNFLYKLVEKYSPIDVECIDKSKFISKLFDVLVKHLGYPFNFSFVEKMLRNNPFQEQYQKDLMFEKVGDKICFKKFAFEFIHSENTFELDGFNKKLFQGLHEGFFASKYYGELIFIGSHRDMYHELKEDIIKFEILHLEHNGFAEKFYTELNNNSN